MLKNIYNQINEAILFEYLPYLFLNQNIPNSLELINNNYFFFFFISINNKGNSIDNFLEFRLNIIQNNAVHQTFFNKLKFDKNIEENEKNQLLQASSIICNKSILSKNNILEIDYIKIGTGNKNNPFNKAIELVKNIIDNLEENSRLFEAFLYFDSGSIENYLESINETNYYYNNSFNEKVVIKSKKYKSEFGLSLLNINQVKSHLKKLIPKLIIRLSSNNKFRAYYEETTNTMIINELTIFQQNTSYLNTLYTKKDSDKFVIPIVMEIFHEMMSHRKERFVDKDELSPRYYRDSSHDFEYRSVKKNCETEKGESQSLPIPESGRVLEKFILSLSLLFSNVFILYFIDSISLL